VEPRDVLAAILEQLAIDAGVEVNVYGAPPAIVAVPALMVRPDNPWRDLTARLPFQKIGERYVVLAIIHAGADPGSLVDTLRALVLLVEKVQDGNPWQWTETSGIVPVSEGGIDYLAATVRLTYLEG
jgi:hypothetical protein